MGRRQLWRRVSALPTANYFKPVGMEFDTLEEIQLLVEEAEAVRLKDLERLEQGECAQKMNISQSTFSRLLDSARQKIADALLNGKAIRIEGGNYEMSTRRFRCLQGHEWEVPFETMITKPPQNCPQCDTPSIMPLFPSGMHHGHRRGRHLRGNSTE